MGISLRIKPEVLVRRIGGPVVEKVVEAKYDQLLRTSAFHFRDRTGALRKTIRIENNNIVAIGDKDHAYWQYIRRFKRGDGFIWTRKVLEQNNFQALRNARNAVRGR